MEDGRVATDWEGAHTAVQKHKSIKISTIHTTDYMICLNEKLLYTAFWLFILFTVVMVLIMYKNNLIVCKLVNNETMGSFQRKLFTLRTD